MLYEVLKHIRNFFSDLDRQVTGHFVIEDNNINPCPVLKNNQYILIEGSTNNDGCHLHTTTFTDLIDEEFDGIITPLNVPKAVLDIVAEIETYQANEKPSNMQSESFGGYSYSKATNAHGQMSSWQNAFGTRLNAWRKL